MTHHDGHWGILGSQQDEDQARAQAVSDPAAYHAAIAAKELHWYDASGEEWLSNTPVVCGDEILAVCGTDGR